MIAASLNYHEGHLIFDMLINRLSTDTILIAFDPVDKAFKFKVNNGAWSPPMGSFVQPPLAEARAFTEALDAFTASVAHDWLPVAGEEPTPVA